MNLRLLLCSDLDRTLLPNGPQPESPGARRLFAELATQPWVTLVYVTGRDQKLVQRAMGIYGLPRPAFVISDVGTNIYDLSTEPWQVWPQWQEEIATDWNGRPRGELRDALGDLEYLRLQERAKQNTYKLSYYVPLHANRQALHQTIERRLQERGVRATLVWSVDEPAGIGLLDVLPRSATKLHAVTFLQQYLQVPIDETVFCGDSGNDLPVLISSIPSVLVANAQTAVREHARQAAHAQNLWDRLYMAKGGFLGMNGNYSAGILEGVAYFHPAIGHWLSEAHAAWEDRS